jgi:hypothetical protein
MMRLDVNRIERSGRMEPTTGWGALRKAASGLAFIAFSVVWMIGWFGSTEGVPALLGWLGLFFVYAGLARIVGAVRGLQAMAVLRKASMTTKATVLDRYSRTDNPGYGGASHTYHLVVQFRASGRWPTLEATVSREVYNASRRGQPVIVRYANADPHIVLIEGEDGF